jgi:hypothetical protein
MISGIVYEIKKITKVKPYVVGISCLIFMGVLYFVAECTQGCFDSGFSAKAYKSISADILQGNFGNYESISEAMDDMLSDGIFPQKMYTQNSVSEFKLYQVIEQEINQTKMYNSYIEGVLENSQKGSSGIFAGDKYSRRNNQKVYRDYRGLSGLTVAFSGSFGIWKFMQSDLWDVLLFIIILLVAYGIFVSDYENGCIKLINTYRLKGVNSYISKMCAGMLITGVIHMSMYIFRFVVACISYGKTDLSQPVQSLYGAYTTSLNISIGMSCILFVLLKLVVIWSLFLVVSLVGIVLRNLKSFYFVLCALSGIFIYVYKMIDANSYLAYFKWINPVSFLSAYNVLFEYRNINICGMPVYYPVLCIITAIITGIVSVLLGIYASKKFHYIKKVRIRKKSKKVCSSIWGYEAKKMWICQKGLIVCVVYLVIGIVTYRPVSDRLYMKDEMNYKYYILEVEGTYTDDKMAILLDEEKRLKDIEEKLELMTGQIDATVLDYYNNELEKSTALNEVINYGCYLRDNGGDFVYGKGYGMLLGKDEGKVLLFIHILGGLALMSFVTVVMLQYDKSIGMDKLINISANKHKSVKSKNLNILVIGFTVWLITFVPWIYNVLSVFGVKSIAAPASSITYLSECPHIISIGGIIGIVYGAFCVYLCINGYIAKLICRYIDDTITAAVLTFIIGMIPVIALY